MMTVLDVREWPSVADVVRESRMSQTRILRLIHRGTLEMVRTRVGIVVDPESVSKWMADREARKDQAIVR